MRKLISYVVLLFAAFTSEARAQNQTIITPPPGGTPIVSGGLYAAGTVFSNGMAYLPGVMVEDARSVTQASYYDSTVSGYSSFGTNYYGGWYPQNSYYFYPTLGLNYNYGTGYYGYNRGYSGYNNRPYYGSYNNNYNNYGTGYRRGYTGNRGYGGHRR